jgi:DNA-binding NarL/FixJ family response regulator
MTAIRVIVVAAFPAVRAGLRALLDGEDGIAVVRAVTPATLPAADDAVDVLVVELGDAAESLLPALGERLTVSPAVLLAHDPEDFAGLAPAAGRGYLLSDAGREELVAAVQAVARGLVVLDPAVAGVVSAAGGRSLRSAGPDDQPEPLTEREHEVLRLMALGLPNKAIALRLGISDHTVKFHVGAILAKLGAAGRTEAVMLAVRRGLLPL